MGNFLDCQQRQTGAFLPGANSYISFIGCASSALSGEMSIVMRARVVARRNGRAGVMKAIVEEAMRWLDGREGGGWMEMRGDQ